MISYNPKDWLTFIFRFHKAETLRRLFPLILVIAAYAAFICFLELHYFPFTKNNAAIRNIPQMHSLLGFVISLLLVFRTNTAYDRWWEGRKLWGALVNNSRNLAIKINSFLPHDDYDSRHFFHVLIPRFAFELRAHLMSENTRLALDTKPHPEIPDFNRNKHIPIQVASLMINKTNLLYKQEKITGDQLIVLNAELQSFMDICGACERIKNTPIPYSYSAFIKKFIFFYIMTLPFGYAISLSYLCIPVIAFIFYVMASLEIIAEEIEDPFGSDANDLPMQQIAVNIQKHIGEILG
ncbi:bestrophin family protein [Deminuibacter soli]|uniref:Bestrophin n=1 Tax=Deminuibacter soli TaxID=2291815 RepID=A0A3E1NM46_9BACT|nr:bestrophin family ion channel [Deminuibacter soli]RFM28898.1 hypothetical protein DXN05_09020 [Deminuibacter soli]